MSKPSFYYSFEKPSTLENYRKHFLCLHTIGVKYDNAGQKDSNWHPNIDWLITIVKEGCYTITPASEKFFEPVVAQPGDVCFFFPQESQTYTNEVDSSRIWLHIIGTAVPDIINELNVTPEKRVVHLNPNKLNSVLEKYHILIDAVKFGNNANIATNAKLLDFLSEIGNASLNIDENNSYEQIKKTADYMNNCYREDISLDKLAEMCLLGKHHYLRLFKSLYHKTPHQFLMSVRMNAAANYLLNTHMGIDEISAMTGFKDRMYFSKSFKKYFNMSPSVYRKKGM